MCDNKKCKSDRIVFISSKSGYHNFVRYCGIEYDGYLPEMKNIGYNYYVKIEICLECGKVQGSFPVDDPDMITNNYHESKVYNEEES